MRVNSVLIQLLPLYNNKIRLVQFVRFLTGVGDVMLQRVVRAATRARSTLTTTHPPALSAKAALCSAAAAASVRTYLLT